jgi:AraC-like DNA-binding protein
MKETAYEPFLAAPHGRYTVTGSSFVWCASRTLCGAFMWGEQTEAETRSILHIFDQYPRQMANSFDIVLDSRGVARVDPSALAQLFSWLVARRSDLSKHLRLQANVIQSGPIGFLLTGLLPVAQWTLPYQLHYAPEDAFRAVAAEGGDALCAEVEAIADRVRGVSKELRAMRELIASRPEIGIGEVSRSLGLSARSLQRVLTRHGTSFRNEGIAARFARAKVLLSSSDQKVASIAHAVGISERALTLLFRSKTGLSPAEWRKKNRG